MDLVDYGSSGMGKTDMLNNVNYRRADYVIFYVKEVQRELILSIK